MIFMCPYCFKCGAFVKSGMMEAHKQKDCPVYQKECAEAGNRFAKFIKENGMFQK